MNGGGVSYMLVDREVVVSESATGKVLWHGLPDGIPGVEVVAIPGTSDAVVRLDHMAKGGAFRNLVRISSSGRVLWRAELPTLEPADAYVAVDYDSEYSRLTAVSWTGYWVVVNVDSGGIVEQEFVK